MPYISYYPVPQGQDPMGAALTSFGQAMPGIYGAMKDEASEKKREDALAEALKYITAERPSVSAGMRGAAATGVETAAAMQPAMPNAPGIFGPIIGAAVSAGVGTAAAAAEAQAAQAGLPDLRRADAARRARVRAIIAADAPGFLDAFDEEVTDMDRRARAADLAPMIERKIQGMTQQVGADGAPVLDPEQGAVIAQGVADGTIDPDQAYQDLAKAEQAADNEAHRFKMSQAKGSYWAELQDSNVFIEMIDRVSPPLFNDMGDPIGKDTHKGAQVVYAGMRTMLEGLSLEEQVALLSAMKGPGGSMLGSMFIRHELGRNGQGRRPGDRAGAPQQGQAGAPQMGVPGVPQQVPGPGAGQPPPAVGPPPSPYSMTPEQALAEAADASAKGADDEIVMDFLQAGGLTREQLVAHQQSQAAEQRTSPTGAMREFDPTQAARIAGAAGLGPIGAASDPSLSGIEQAGREIVGGTMLALAKIPAWFNKESPANRMHAARLIAGQPHPYTKPKKGELMSSMVPGYEQAAEVLSEAQIVGASPTKKEVRQVALDVFKIGKPGEDPPTSSVLLSQDKRVLNAVASDPAMFDAYVSQMAEIWQRNLDDAVRRAQKEAGPGGEGEKRPKRKGRRPKPGIGFVPQRGKGPNQ